MPERETNAIFLDANGKEIKIGKTGRLSESGRTQSSIARRFPQIVSQFPNLEFQVTAIEPYKNSALILAKALEPELAKPFKMPLVLKPEDIVIENE